MFSLNASSNTHILTTPLFCSLGFGAHFKIRTKAVLVMVKRERFFGVNELKKMRTRNVVLCKGELESEAELVLEREIMEFMKNSKYPNDFPTKKELLDAGRVDLVEAIIEIGGWLSLGWDDDDVDENECDRKEFDETRLDTSLSCGSSHQFVSSSGRSVETDVQEDAGIEGILHRLEKHRNLSFGISVQENGHGKDNGGHRGYVSADVDGKTYRGAMLNRGIEGLEDKVYQKEIKSNDIKSRLQHMRLELSSALCSLRSKSETLNPEVHKSSPSELQHLSDTWEFQENEIMNARDRLRSIRAKLAVLEGKMTLSSNEAQKIVEAKQRRIDSGSRTLQLHTTYIIWPNSASEVLLAGSFDGWTTQRKMKRSQTGVFSLSLKLYPGRYEIKFIVDGVWRVDPLRPIVNSEGYENNVLFIHK